MSGWQLSVSFAMCLKICSFLWQDTFLSLQTLFCFRRAKYEAFRRRCFLAFYIVARGCLIRTSMLLLITERIFILIRFFFGDAVTYVFLEMSLSFFQQFDRLACVSRARFIGLLLVYSSIFVHSVTTWFKLHRLRLLTVLRVVFATVFGLVQASLILHVDLISCRYF